MCPGTFIGAVGYSVQCSVFGDMIPAGGVGERRGNAIRNGTQPPIDGRAGLSAVRILEAAQASIPDEGKRVWLEGLM